MADSDPSKITMDHVMGSDLSLVEHGCDGETVFGYNWIGFAGLGA